MIQVDRDGAHTITDDDDATRPALVIPADTEARERDRLIIEYLAGPAETLAAPAATADTTARRRSWWPFNRG